MRKSRPGVSGIVTLFCCLLAAGCSPQPSPVESKSFRTVLMIAPSKELRDQLRQGVVDMKGLRDRERVLTLAANKTRSLPGYSVRDVSREACEFLLRHGVMTATCDITFQLPDPSSLGSLTEVSGAFKIGSTRATSVPENSSWVAQAAWKTVPREGDFNFRLPMTVARGSSSLRIAELVRQHVEALLSNRIEPELHRLLTMTGAQRFLERDNVYGTVDCAPEACPHEDGIDCLTMLQLAQTIRDPDSPPPYLAALPAADREELVALANETCRLMVPKIWTSVLKEKRRGRPAFLSKTSVILAGAERVEFTRNAFMAGNEAGLLRIEKNMVDLVAKFYQAKVKLAALVIEPKPAQPQDENFENHIQETTCEECGFKGRFHYDEEGNGFCPRCVTMPEIALPEPLTGRAGAKLNGP